jgi:hypothetical protein
LTTKQADRHQGPQSRVFPGKNTPSFDLPSFLQTAILFGTDKPDCAGIGGSDFD